MGFGIKGGKFDVDEIKGAIDIIGPYVWKMVGSSSAPDDVVEEIMTDTMKMAVLGASAINAYLSEGEGVDKDVFLAATAMAMLKMDMDMEMQDFLSSSSSKSKFEKVDGDTLPDELIEQIAEETGMSEEDIRGSYIYGVKVGGDGNPNMGSVISPEELIEKLRERPLKDAVQIDFDGASKSHKKERESVSIDDIFDKAKKKNKKTGGDE